MLRMLWMILTTAIVFSSCTTLHKPMPVDFPEQETAPALPHKLGCLVRSHQGKYIPIKNPCVISDGDLYVISDLPVFRNMWEGYQIHEQNAQICMDTIAGTHEKRWLEGLFNAD